ncbi:Osmosensitive K+ channel histidine kinase KdpD [Francisella cf. novicida Fx1]|uniref:ATP-binding protein n=1 Tax=Francisella tularensis TaxID=263 RepID=UPI00020BCFEA|nr:ATP-binding protein [Francisella tularensis]AEE88141.1 Osmosensitive K+ channel histidine kinase KdpD [Francisella cf. novicida Fx1]
MDNQQKVDALLNLANKSQESKKGKLKIFLGYAPGVGKSYAMLNNARALQKDNKDVVVGLLVSHGRADTQALLEGLEIMPLKKVNYRGRVFEELDIDAIKARKPDVVIVDELPHSNLPASRNKKRYIDIEELLDEGISVYTAINIQHIASLSYEVTQLTQANVNEIVPNDFIQSADELVVVDVSPEELIKRLKQGKVYKSDAIDRALERYFQYTNLTILRDYTFRMAANHVGQDIQQYRKLYQHGSAIPTSPYVLVCCGYDEATPSLLRKGKLLATTLNARLIAVFVQKPNKVATKLNFGVIRRYKMLASSLGYNIDHILGDRLSDSILEYAKSIGATDLVIGKSIRPKWKDKLFGSVVYDIIRNNNNGMQVHIVSINKKEHKLQEQPRHSKIKTKGLIIDVIKSALIAAVSGVFIFFSLSIAGLVSQTLCFLMVLAACAYRYGLIPSIISSLVGLFLYIYLYLEPNFVFHISSLAGIITFAFFMTIVIFSSHVILRTKRAFTLLKERENSISVLYRFTKMFNEKSLDKDLRSVFLHALEEYFKCDFVFLSVSDGELDSAAFPQHPNFNQKELAAAKWSFKYKDSCGKGTNTFAGLDWAVEPLVIENRVLGVIAIYLSSETAVERITTDSVILSSMLSHISHILLKRNLEKEEKKSLLLDEQRRLQKSMLSSVSHDLKTPLASIMGALSSIKSYKDSFNPEQQVEMLDLALTESKRLDSYIDNIIQMLKVDSGKLSLNIQNVNSNLFLTEIQETCARVYNKQKFRFIMPKEPFEIELDPVLFQQVILNLIDNAVKFTCDFEKEIIISLKRKKAAFCLFEVQDKGIGLRESDMEKIFTIFHRIEKRDSYTHGNGLGLAICKGIVTAHNGKIRVYSDGEGKGSVFKITLPLKSSTN